MSYLGIGQLLGPPFGGGSSGASFVGPLDDITNIAVAYSTRRLLSSYAGDALRLRRDSDDAEEDFGFDSSGDLDTAAISTWLSGANGYVTTWYDQSGAGKNATQTTAGAQPLYVANGQNSKPVLRFDGTDDAMLLSNTTVASAVCAFSATPNDGFPVLGNQTNSDLVAPGVNTTIIRYRGGANTDLTFLALADPMIMSVVRSGTSASAWVNGTAATNNPQTANNAAVCSALMLRGDLSRYQSGDLFEIVILSAALSMADRNTIRTAANTYWSIY